jgi:hypothetical protein
MSMPPLKSILFAAALAFGAAAPLPAAQKPAAPAKAAKADEAPAGDAIPYEELKSHLGERVVVQTRFKSTRTGTLTKVSQFELILSVPTAQGPAELTMPRDTVLRVTLAQTPKPPKP